MSQGIPHEATEKTQNQVFVMAAAGTKHDIIAKILQINQKTLKKHYKYQLDLGRAKANSLVVGALFNNAMSGNVTAQIFWLKTRAGWRESTPGSDEPTKLIRIRATRIEKSEHGADGTIN